MARPSARTAPAARRPPPATEPAVHVLHGGGQRRRLEDDRRRPHLDADLRRPADRIDRRDRRRAVRSQHRSTSAAAKDCSGRISRWATASTSRPTPGKTWTHLGLRDAQQIPQHRRRSAQSEPAVRRRARPSVRPERGARHLPLDRRRPARSRRCSTRTRTPAATTSTSIRRIPTSSTPRCGKSGRGRGRTRRGRAPAAASSSRPTAARRGSRSRTGCRPSSRRTWPIAPANPQAAVRHRRRLVRDRCAASRGAAGIYRSDDAGETWTRITDRRAAGRPDRRRRPADAASDPKNPDIADHGEHRVVEVDRRRQDVGAVQGRAGRRRLPERLDQPEQPRHHPAGRRPGRGRHAQRRRDVELLVQPADRAALPRRGRQRVSVPRLRRPAGERIGVRREPRQRRRRSPIREWHPVGVDEYGYVAPDPLDPDIVYGGSSVTRFDRRTGQVSNVGPIGGRGGRRRQPDLSARCARSRSCSRRSTSARCSSPTTTCGRRSTAATHWKQISPDLTRKTWEVPASVGKYLGDPAAKPPQRGVIYTIAPSYRTSTASGSAPTTA